MQKVVVKTATEARNEFFDLIAAAKYGGQVTVVTVRGKVAALITPVEEERVNWQEIREAINRWNSVKRD